ncbi:MAG: hypothetical protein ABW122_06900 [Ilumatobacteraceae bacterium]
MPSLSVVPPDAIEPNLAVQETRRCWRCLQMFPEAVDREPHPDEWWVCDPCHAILLPSIGHRS